MIDIRNAKIEDADLILYFIKQLAIYEKLEHQMTATKALIEKWIFKEKKAEVIFILENDQPVGFVLYFYNFSTFLAKPGIYIEDLFVLPEYRGKGYGKQVFSYLAKKAQTEGYGRMEWICLDWNKPSIQFYLSLGAKPLSEWTVYRLDENAYVKLIHKAS